MEWHGNLPQEITEQIKSRIPNVNDGRFNLAIDYNISLSITDHLNNTNLVGAIECLMDARKRFSQIQYSLYQALTCVTWNREFTSTSSEENAIFAGQYYLSYVSLLLYAAAEDIASFIIRFMNIKADISVYFKTDKGKRKLKGMKFPSDHVKVGIFLRENYKGHPLTNICSNLKADQDWQKALDYRNTWVHDKPPSIKGSGVEFTREKNSAIDSNGNQVTYLSLPKQEYTIDDLMDICLKAGEAFATALAELAEIVINDRAELSKMFIQPDKDQP